MRNKIRHELFVTEKFVSDFAYVSNLSLREKEEVALYRAELVRLLTEIDNSNVKFTIPPRPPVFDRYQ